VTQHFRAGANHVCLQVLTADRLAMSHDKWQTLATLIHTPLP
jgi:hypothetical protein